MDNRETILEGALQLFAARGYDAVGVQEIVEAAGITKPTLYYYFGSKRGLLDALLQERFASLRSRVEAAADYHRDLPLTLTRLVSTFFALAREQPAFFRLQLTLWFAPPYSEAWQAVAPWHAQQQALLEALFTRAANDHGNMRGRQRAYAATLLGMIHTYIGLALNGYVELDEPLVQQAVHQFQHGIYS